MNQQQREAEPFSIRVVLFFQVLKNIPHRSKLLNGKPEALHLEQMNDSTAYP